MPSYTCGQDVVCAPPLLVNRRITPHLFIRTCMSKCFCKLDLAVVSLPIGLRLCSQCYGLNLVPYHKITCTHTPNHPCAHLQPVLPQGSHSGAGSEGRTDQHPINSESKTQFVFLPVSLAWAVQQVNSFHTQLPLMYLLHISNANADTRSTSTDVHHFHISACMPAHTCSRLHMQQACPLRQAQTHVHTPSCAHRLLG